jgi:hypothetical protein
MAIANLNEFLRNCEFGRSNSLAGMEEPAVSDYKRVAGEKALAAGCNEFDTKPIELIGWSQQFGAFSPTPNDAFRTCTVGIDVSLSPLAPA